MLQLSAAIAGLALCAAACAAGDSLESVDPTDLPEASSSSPAPAATAGSSDMPIGVQRCADVVAATVEKVGDTYRFDVTVRSGDTGWDKYADAWVVSNPEGTVLGERVLLHPHENEQPFTRSLAGVTIPEDITEVVVAARDSVNGFCGVTVTLLVP